jgi:DNA-binding CsgD family transcriptional regulator
VAAAAAFLKQAADLTPDPARRAARALVAAQAMHQAGAFDAVSELLTTAQSGPLDELQGARVELLRGRLAVALGSGSEALPLLFSAAKRFEPLDPALARDTYLETLAAAMYSGRLEKPGGVFEVARAARAAPAPPRSSRATDLLLDGLAALITEGYAAAAPPLKRALRAFLAGSVSDEEQIRWLGLICRMAAHLWDDEARDRLSARHVVLARRTGALAVLPIALNTRLAVHVNAGDFAAAASDADEAQLVSEASGIRVPPYGALALAAFRGREAEIRSLTEAILNDVAPQREGVGLTAVHWARAVLFNGHGRYAPALAASEKAAEYSHELLFANWVPSELIEAAARVGMPERAAGALRRLSEAARASGTDWALGIEARSRALLGDADAAEPLYQEAIERLGRTRVRLELARTRLLYGEWLRRERRRSDAREQLRAAHTMLTAFGAEAFAERAARELLATGETTRRRIPETRDDLTPREAQIAQLARDGLSNSEIGARLFISSRTVEYHLTKVFAKRGITSRLQLDDVLAGGAISAARTTHADSMRTERGERVQR